MVSIKIDLKKRDFVWVGLVVVLLSVGFGIAAWDSSKTMYHEGADVKVVFNGSIMSLNDALSMINVGGGFGGGGMSFGVWNDRTGDGVADTVSDGVVYGPAVSDGIVVVYQPENIVKNPLGYTDSSSSPTTVVTGTNSGHEYNEAGGFSFPVRKGDYWKTVDAYTVRWMPIVSSGGSGVTAWESGWFACSKGSTYTKTHDLGSTNLLFNVLISTSSSGTNPWTGTSYGQYDGTRYSGYTIHTVTSTSLKIRFGPTAISFAATSNSGVSSGYCQIIAIRTD